MIMSITDLDRVDAVGVEGTTLHLMLSDHMDWEYEDIHLEILQDKINLYLQYIENKQYVQQYGDEFLEFIIEIYFKEKIPKNCLKFLQVASAQLNPNNIYINMHFDKE